MTLMPEFRRQLLEAAASRAHEPGRRHPGFGLRRSGRGVSRPRLGASIAAAASILVVIAVVAVVLTLGHAQHGVLADSVEPVARERNSDGMFGRGHQQPARVAASTHVPAEGAQGRPGSDDVDRQRPPQISG